MLEGLAFTFAQYSPYQLKDERKLLDMSKFGKGNNDIMKVLSEIRTDKEMLKNISQLSNKDEYVQQSAGNYIHWYIMAMLEHYSDCFLQLTDDIKLPESLDSSQENMKQIVDLLCWLEDMATIVYVKSESVNQIFLLHGITGTYNNVLLHVEKFSC